MIDSTEPVLIDWESARRVAASDGFAFQPVPPSSQKPSREERAAADAVAERNRTFANYVKRPETLKRAETNALPQLERWLVRVPREPFGPNGSQIPPINAPSGPPLSLRLFPDRALVSQISGDQLTTAQVVGEFATKMVVAALAGGRVARQEFLAYVGDYELINETSGRTISSGRLEIRFRYDPFAYEFSPYEKIFATMIWNGIIQNSPAIRRIEAGSRPENVASRPSRTPTPTKVAEQAREEPTPTTAQNLSASSTQQVAESAAQPVKSRRLAGSPPLFEGSSLSAFTPEQMSIYCSQTWRTGTAPDGRTEYNPCTEKSAFSR
ncbi:MAG: hypothetical protein AAF293_07610 [Pseudomonadota bacterium]